MADLQDRGWVRTFPHTAALVARLKREERFVEGRDGIVNLKEALDAPLVKIGGALRAELDKAWGDDITQFLVVGGGGYLLQEYLELRDGLTPVVPAHGEWQNALGLYLAGLIYLEAKEDPVAAQGA